MLRFLSILLFLILLVCGAVAGFSLYDMWINKPPELLQKDISVLPGKYQLLDTGFSHRYNPLHGVPYTAAAFIDIDRDGRDELFLGGGVRQSDALLKLQEGGFVDISDDIGLVKLGGGMTTGVAVLDLDGNGYSDLLVARENKLFAYYNTYISDGLFSGEEIELAINPDYIILGPVITDVNRDGAYDFFVPVVERGNLYNFRENHSEKMVRLFLNNGDNTFQDMTGYAGLRYQGAALQAAFPDIDNDGLPDLVVLATEGRLRIWKNLGNLLFEEKKLPGFSTPGDFLGFAAGDYDNDGKIDLFLSNRATTIPDILAKIIFAERPLRSPDWFLLRGLGSFQFEKRQLTSAGPGYGLARGAVFTDYNGDGLEDLLVAQNHPDWPGHFIKALRLPGQVLVQDAEGRFVQIEVESSLQNRAWEVTPLVGDVNGDGKPDILHLNLGDTSPLYLNRTERGAYVKIVLPDSIESFGAQVRVKMLSGKTIRRSWLVGEELCSDSSHALFIGVGEDVAIEVGVEYYNGKRVQKSGVLNNTIVRFR